MAKPMPLVVRRLTLFMLISVVPPFTVRLCTKAINRISHRKCLSLFIAPIMSSFIIISTNAAAANTMAR